MADSFVTRHGERFATDETDDLHIPKIKVDSSASDAVVTSIKPNDINQLVEQQQKIVKQLRILNLHMSFLTNQTIESSDIDG